jgi:uncharacterized protein (UPF0335 family)
MQAGRNGGAAADMLVDFIESIESLEDEKRRIAEEIKGVKARAKSAGFDAKVLTQMLRERRMSHIEREEFQALCEMYRAALGMLNGTPLGEAARKRLMGKLPPKPDEPNEELASPASDEPSSADDLDAARAAGRAAAREGKRIIDNPYIAGDPRRAAWDEGWCAETGTDGMEVPEAWRRQSAKKKRGDGKPDGDGGAEGEGGDA